MLGRIRSSSKRTYGDDQSINGVGSLLGGSGGISLNGESVMLPGDGEESIISVNTEGMNQVISNVLDEKKFEMSVVGSAISDEESERITGTPETSPRTQDSRDNSFSSSERACLPIWITEAPTWLKATIAVCTALLLGALVLVAIAAALNGNSGSSGGSSNAVVGDPFLPQAPLTSRPTASPVLPPTSEPVAPVEPGPVAVLPLATTSPSVVASISPSVTAYPSAEPSKPPKDGRPAPVAPLPSSAPSAEPTWAPQLPIEGSTTVFYLTAHRPGSEQMLLFERNLPLLPTDADFMMHLGDWNSPNDTNCTQASYQAVSDLYKTSSVPVFWTVGDNEYNDCPNYPENVDYWYDSLLGYETKFWPPRWEVSRQEDYPENFSFVLRNILYVAINLVGGEIIDRGEWDRRRKANLEWIDDQFWANRDVAVMVIFMHSDPDLPANSDFFVDLFDYLREYNKPTMLVHRNLGLDAGGVEEDYNDIPDMVLLIAEGGIWPPMRVEIDAFTGSFSFNQDDWFTNAVPSPNLV